MTSPLLQEPPRTFGRTVSVDGHTRTEAPSLGLKFYAYGRVLGWIEAYLAKVVADIGDERRDFSYTDYVYDDYDNMEEITQRHKGWVLQELEHDYYDGHKIWVRAVDPDAGETDDATWIRNFSMLDPVVPLETESKLMQLMVQTNNIYLTADSSWRRFEQSYSERVYPELLNRYLSAVDHV